MFYLKRLCVIVAFVLMFSVLLIFVETQFYNTSHVNVFKEPSFAKFIQYGGSYASVKTKTQLKSHTSELDENLDYERLEIKYQNEACPIRNLTRPKKSTNRTGLLSFPASGNTWTRHLIQQLTEWTSHINISILEWKKSYISWFKIFKRNSLIVVYENLKQNVFSELLRMIRFLEIEVTPKDLWCTLVNQEGDYHRLSRNLTETSVFTLFTSQQKQQALKAICDVTNVARKTEIDLNISQYLATLSDTPNIACS